MLRGNKYFLHKHSHPCALSSWLFFLPILAYLPDVPPLTGRALTLPELHSCTSSGRLGCSESLAVLNGVVTNIFVCVSVQNSYPRMHSLAHRDCALGPLVATVPLPGLLPCPLLEAGMGMVTWRPSCSEARTREASQRARLLCHLCTCWQRH